MLRSSPPTSSERATCATLSRATLSGRGGMAVEVGVEDVRSLVALFIQRPAEGDGVGVEALNLEHAQHDHDQALGALEVGIGLAAAVGERIGDEGAEGLLERFAQLPVGGVEEPGGVLDPAVRLAAQEPVSLPRFALVELLEHADHPVVAALGLAADGAGDDAVAGQAE